MEKIFRRQYQNEEDFWRIRNFLREIFILDGRVENHVAAFDHWRWHYVKTCHETAPVEEVTVLWETKAGKIVAVLHPICHDEVNLHIHPDFVSTELIGEMVEYAEKQFSDEYESGQRILFIPAIPDDETRQVILERRGFKQYPPRDYYWVRDLSESLPDISIPSGYCVRSMGDQQELSSRSWASWRAFHAEEPDENYDGDYSWYRNLQSVPLYRRDLDIVAVTSDDDIVGFSTISYDDYTRTALIVLEGVAAEHQSLDLSITMAVEGMQRLSQLGCKKCYAFSNDEINYQLYSEIMQPYQIASPWIKIWDPLA